jgi:glutathione S-transferase
MELYGVYLSPYTRRVAIALNLLDMPYTHNAVRVFERPDVVREHNPLARVPTLVLEDGSALIESGAILDEIDQMAGPGRALTPPSGPSRRAVLQIAALGVGVMEKAQWAFYETRFHPEEKVHQPWIDHNDAQVIAGLEHLNGLAKAAGDGWMAGTQAISQADISVAVAHSFAKKVRPALTLNVPDLDKLTARCEALPAFQATAL